MAALTLRIRRPGIGVSELTNELLEEAPEATVSSFTYGSPRTLVVDGAVAMARGYECILFELLRENLEVIAVFDTGRDLAGYYVNLNSEPRPFDGGYEITDWFLDVWVFPDLRYAVLDREEFEAAVAAGHLPPPEATRARSLLERVTRTIAAGAFPPRIVRDYLVRARPTRARRSRGGPAGRRSGPAGRRR